MSSHNTRRRTFLKLAGLGVTAGLAGCSSDGGDGGGGSDGGDGGGDGSDGDDGGSTGDGGDGGGDMEEDFPIDLESFREADIDWQKHEGTDLTLGFVSHPFVDNFRPLTEAFEALTGINTQWQILPENEFRTKRQTDASTGAGEMDVFMMDQVIAQFMEAGWLQTLDPYFDSEDLYDDDWYQVDDHNDAALTAAHGHGTTDQWTGIPITTEVTVTFYRTDLYEKHGLEEPETYAELRENARILDENEDIPGVVNRGLRGFGMNAYTMNSVLRGWGGELWNSYPDDSGLDDPEVIEAGEYYVNLLRDHGPSDAESYAWSDSLTAMQQGNAAQIANDANLFWGGLTGEDAAVPDEIGITSVPVPDVDGSQFAPNAFTWTISTSQASDNSEAAFLFMLFATSPEATRFMGENGAPFITRESAWESDWYREQINDEFAEVTLESLGEAIPDTFDARYPEWAEEYSVHLQSAIAGDKSAEQAFMDAASDAERIASQ
jgi:ABC-type glycerol-3-phosphate transport system substrate-binding protein